MATPSYNMNRRDHSAVQRFKQTNICQILGPASCPLHAQQILLMGDWDADLAERDLVGTRTHVTKYAEMRWQRKHVEQSVVGNQMPLIT